MKLNYFLYFTLMTLLINISKVKGQDILVGQWKEIELLSDSIKWIHKNPVILTLDKDGKYSLVLYAFDLEDTLEVKPKKIKRKGRYKIDSQNNIISFIPNKQKDKTGYDRLFKFSNGILEIVEDRGDRGEGLRGPRIIITKYLRLK